MKRVGNLMAQMRTEQNFIRAERLLGRNKPENRRAQYIARHALKYGRKLFVKVQAGTFTWHEPRQKTIKDSYKGKERGLKIPCLEDQAAQLAWLNIATPYIERKNYYYNCGSVPRAGQTRCTKALQRWLKKPGMKYAATTDIRKFYDTCPHALIRRGLERIFKDREFVEFAMGFVAGMSETGIGIAIGYPSSHWLANVALMELDHEMRRLFPRVKYTRYMDDVAMAGRNKRELRRAVDHMKGWIEQAGMALKRWSRFRISGRGVTFLSYRFFRGYTILTKPLMARIARRMRKAGKRMNAHAAAAVISYMGILKYCDSYNFREKHVYPFIKRWACIRLISDKTRMIRAAAAA